MEVIKSKAIKLTAQNLLRYGEIVLTREWTTQLSTIVTERYIVWDTDKMNGVPEDQCKSNKKKMYVLTMSNGEVITMKQV